MKTYEQLIRHSGNNALFTAVEMSVIALANNYPLHIHAEGLRGTGKTTLMRAARTLLPPITRIKNCLYNCDPERPHCPEHRHLTREQIAAIGTEVVPRPFLEISHNAKAGTVVGSIDLTRLTDGMEPAAALLPGTIPQAHRGVIFIDEINRLADTSPELADILLDVMGTKPGRLQVEETGLPVVQMPALVTIWAASNPDEDPGPLGQIRRQLSDRFDLSVYMGRPGDYQSVLGILDSAAAPMSAVPFSAALEIGKVTVPVNLKHLLAAIYVDFGLESLRALEALAKTAGLRALTQGRYEVEVQDISFMVPLVLAHRADNATITNILNYLENWQYHKDWPKAAGLTAADSGTGVISAKEQVQPGDGWLAGWWQRLRQKLTLKRQSPAEQAPATDGKPGYNNYESRSSSGTSQIMNPNDAPVVAPPNPARPLNELPVDKFVDAKDQQSHV